MLNVCPSEPIFNIKRFTQNIAVRNS